MRKRLDVTYSSSFAAAEYWTEFYNENSPGSGDGDLDTRSIHDGGRVSHTKASPIMSYHGVPSVTALLFFQQPVHRLRGKIVILLLHTQLDPFV